MAQVLALNPFDIAKRQLATAIRLYFQDDDAVAVYALTRGAAKYAGVVLPPSVLAGVLDGTAAPEAFSFDENFNVEALALTGAALFHIAPTTMIEWLVFDLWSKAVHNLVTPEIQNITEAFFENIHLQPAGAQKARGRQVLEDCLADARLKAAEAQGVRALMQAFAQKAY